MTLSVHTTLANKMTLLETLLTADKSVSLGYQLLIQHG